MLGEVQRDLEGLGRALPGDSLAFLPWAFAGGCDAGFGEAVRAALEPHLPAHPEMRRMLAEALEQIRICAAERQEHTSEAGAYFARAAREPRTR
jgi:alanyl aminopeptidase